MDRFFAILLIILICGASTHLNAQNVIQEEEISIGILKWHYDNYPNAKSTEWVKNEVEGTIEYSVTFQFEDQNYTSIYFPNGKRKEEFLYLEIAPIDLTNFLYDRFSQFKLKKLIRKTTFPSKKVSYLLQVKSKKEGTQELELEESTLKILNQVVLSDN